MTQRIVALVAASMAVLLLVGASCVGAAEDVGSEPVLEALQADIAVLESVNQLDLTKQQVSGLVDITVELHKASDKYASEQAALRGQLGPLLQKKRALMVKDEVVPEALEQQISAYQGQMEGLDRKVVERLIPFADRFRTLLSAAQVQIISGDYEARRQAEEWLDSVRDIAQESFKDELRPIVREFADPTINLDEKTLTAIFTEAHGLDSKAYPKRKAEFVTRLAPLFRPEKGDDQELLVQFFMHPRMTVVLQDKLAAMD